MMTLQEIFDKAVGGVIAQGGPSAVMTDYFGIKCLYRGPNGRRCAAGHVLTDEEGMLAADASDLGGMLSELIGGDLIHATRIIHRLQCAHDEAANVGSKVCPDALFLERFIERANIIAHEQGLKGIDAGALK